MREQPIQHVHVATPQGPGGSLAREQDQYVFTYAPGTPPAAAVSLLMPPRAAQYLQPRLHPIFQMNLPEGYVLEQLRQRFAKVTPFDPLLLLALAGQEAAIGRVRVSLPESPDGFSTAARGEQLSTLLSWSGAESIFGALAERYLLRSGVSGVQPKLLVPEIPPAGKAALATSELIVKSGGADYPGLAVNEFVCMQIARRAGLPVPEFFLSENTELFVIRRFDRTSAGEALGFEDMAALMGRGADEKYMGSYEQIAKVIRLFCAAEAQGAGLSQLFDQVALSCMVGNGDAHLKNFGLLYSDPTTADTRLAPVYDIVCTTAYLPDDSLALTLGGTKCLFAARANLHAFGESLGLKDLQHRFDRLITAAQAVLSENLELLGFFDPIERALRDSVESFAKSVR
jgi:serine/threonine-protein kinase HipA